MAWVIDLFRRLRHLIFAAGAQVHRQGGKHRMRDHIELAVDNIIRHGDTDIFPFPFENHAFFDDRDKIVELLLQYHDNFDDYLTRLLIKNRMLCA